MRFVVDQHPVGALGPSGAHPPLGITITIFTPSAAKISSKARVNLASRSRMKKQKEPVRSPRSMTRLRASSCACVPRDLDTLMVSILSIGLAAGEVMADRPAAEWPRPACARGEAGGGTGGTIAGVGKCFRERNSSCKVVAVEPNDSCLLMCGGVGRHLIEGISDGFVPGIFARHRHIIDEIAAVDSDAAIS